MSRNHQYSMDSERLSVLIERYTNIPKQKVNEFVAEYGVEEMLPCANLLCKTAAQRDKLAALFEFKNLYETVKRGEANKEYRMDSADSAKDYFRNYFADVKDKEYVVTAYLKANYAVIATKPMSTGTLDSATFDPREIIKEALFCNAKSIVVAHNHPSGSMNISPQDIQATKNLQLASLMAGVNLVDHVIVAGDGAVSLAENRHISQIQDKSSVIKAATAASEKAAGYAAEAKPQSIKQQLAIAEKQLDADAITKNQKTRNNQAREAR